MVPTTNSSKPYILRVRHTLNKTLKLDTPYTVHCLSLNLVLVLVLSALFYSKTFQDTTMFLLISITFKSIYLSVKPFMCWQSKSMTKLRQFEHSCSFISSHPPSAHQLVFYILLYYPPPTISFPSLFLSLPTLSHLLSITTVELQHAIQTKNRERRKQATNIQIIQQVF